MHCMPHAHWWCCERFVQFPSRSKYEQGFKIASTKIIEQVILNLVQIPSFGSRRSTLCKGTLWFQKQDIIKMLQFLVDNIFVGFFFFFFAGKVFQQIVGIPMGTNYAPLLADIFLYSYEAEFIQSLLSTGRKQLASRFNFTYRYIDDAWSINNPEHENYLG